jgi:asparagine synthase (glutamine-hydrolysing)
MFAFAIWDKYNHRLFAARDRLGEKPFYYFQSREVLVFASEIKALFEFSQVTKAINLNGIEEYFTFKYLAGENTLFKDIYSLPPGHSLVFQNNQKTIKKYWDLSEESIDGPRSIKDLESAYNNLLHQSVEERLMSEVPLGTFNSGGIDSSLITAITSSKTKSRVNSFTIGFDESDYDESPYAEMISQKYNTIHHSLKITNREFAENLPKAIWLNDEPLNHPNAVMIYLLSQLTKKSVTVALTGEGADELFGGYPRYFILKYFHQYLKAPKSVQWVMRQIIRFLDGRRVRKIRDIIDLSFNDAVMHNSVYLNPSIVHSVLNEDLLTGKFDQRLAYLTEPPFTQDLQRLFYFEIKTYLVSILNRADKMTMGASIEARPPFLDHRCVEFCFKIPLNYRLHGWETKFFLKRFSRKYLPPEIINRKKSGFGVPLEAWLRDTKGLGRYLDLLKSDDFRNSGLFNYHSIDILIKHHLAGKENHSEILWELINFQLWKQIYFDAKCFFYG